MPEINNLLGSTRRVVEEQEPLNNCRGVTYRVLNVGGGDIDESKVIVKSDTIPTADADSAGKMYIYAGETDATYTHGYIYECVATNTYADTTTFEPATISGTVVTTTSDALSSVLAQYLHADPTTVVSGTLTYDQGGNLWVFYGYDADSTEVGHFQLYQEDWEDAGFTFTGTPADGDVVAFATTITIASTSYAWVRLNTQPIPTPAEIGAVTQETHTITLVSTDWSLHTQTKTVSGVTADNTVIVAPASSSAADYAAAEILCTAQAANSLTFTCTTDPTNNVSVNIVILN